MPMTRPVIVGLVDYGAGNLTSVIKGLTAVGASVRLCESPADARGLDGLVIPGVGHFEATRALDDEWRDFVRAEIRGGTPILGICLGMQWLFEGSDEAPEAPGLGLFEGRCFRLPASVKVPHVGWNSLDFADRPSRLLDGLRPGAMAYFTHSFAAPVIGASVATTSHGAAFASAVEQERIFGAQFHPEKSSATGLRILTNFVAAVRAR
jgi:glutamine amidotransferase